MKKRKKVEGEGEKKKSVGSRDKTKRTKNRPILLPFHAKEGARGRKNAKKKKKRDRNQPVRIHMARPFFLAGAK